MGIDRNVKSACPARNVIGQRPHGERKNIMTNMHVKENASRQRDIDGGA
jgi:hypothetical protein